MSPERILRTAKELQAQAAADNRKPTRKRRKTRLAIVWGVLAQGLVFHSAKARSKAGSISGISCRVGRVNGGAETSNTTTSATTGQTRQRGDRPATYAAHRRHRHRPRRSPRG